MRRRGEFKTSLELIDKALRLSPRDPFRATWYADKAGSHFALKQYDQAIESARRAVEISPNNSAPYLYLIPALALAGQESQAHEALGHYLHLTNSGAPRTVAGWKAAWTPFINPIDSFTAFLLSRTPMSSPPRYGPIRSPRRSVGRESGSRRNSETSPSTHHPHRHHPLPPAVPSARRCPRT